MTKRWAISERAVVLGMLAICTAIIAPNALAVLRVYDGGIAASAGTFILHGLVPYRDFWLLYGPLSGVVVAIPTAVLGPSTEILKGAGFVVFLTEALFAYLIARVWAAPVVAAIIGISAVVMLPAVMGLELSAWSLAMALALAALYLALGTRRSRLGVGLLIGVAFLVRFDVGAYALIAAMVMRERRDVLVGFSLVALPAALLMIATTDLARLYEQIIWYPLIGQRQFRGLPGPDAQVGAAGPIYTLALSVIPKALIVLSVVYAFWRARPDGESFQRRGLLALAVFAALCQLQAQARVDLEHLAQAATPAILLLACWYRHDRLGLPRFSALAGVAAACWVIGLLGFRLIGTTPSAADRAILATSAWIREATGRDEPIFVGLTSHRFTVTNPLVVYYLADRKPAVHDTMFNPGVTNTDWGQTRMIADLERSNPPYIVLEQLAGSLGEPTNDSRIPGSSMLDDYLGARYRRICDVANLVIEARAGPSRVAPPCPVVEP